MAHMPPMTRDDLWDGTFEELSQMDTTVFGVDHPGDPYAMVEFYQIVEPLGEGAYAKVYRAINTYSGEESAMKILDFNAMEDDLQKKKSWYATLNELRCHFAIQGPSDAGALGEGHPNIMRFFNWYYSDGLLGMIFELGQSDLFRRHYIDNQGDPLTKEQLRPVTRQIASALDYIHNLNMAHRDLKCENIMIMSPSIFDYTPVKICDFNLAKFVSTDDPTTPITSPLGTIFVMDPDQLRTWEYSDTFYTRKCDIWAMGHIMHELIMDKPGADIGGADIFEQNINCSLDTCTAVDANGNYRPGQWDKCVDCRACMVHKRMTQEWGPNQGEFDSNSDALKDLMSHCVTLRTEDRYTPAQVLEHPWLQE